MNPQLAIIIGTLIIQYGPEFAATIVKIFNNNAPTQADWDAAFALARNPIAQVNDMLNAPVALPIPVVPTTTTLPPATH